jgi:signal transduction histidine kinase
MSSPNEHRAESMEDALAAVDRLETTITDLLTLARDTGPAREPIDIGAVLVELAPGWRVVAEAQGRPLEVGAEPGLPPVRVSGAAVRQVLEVLVSNALVHGRGEVTVRVGETPGGIAVDVVDEGDGITGDLEAVFGGRGDVTPSTSPGGPSGGSHHGIGLPLARSLAEAEGGRLLLRNAGPRPRFSLLLPAPDAAP